MTWKEIAIKDVGKVITGKTPSKSESSYYGGDIPFVTPGELDHNRYVYDARQKITEEGAKQVSPIPKNAVMVCCIGSLGKIGISGKRLATNQQINSIIFDESKVDPKYGYYACSRLKPILQTIAPSTTVAIVNKTRFENLTIPLPPLPEQRRIAAILDKTDSLRRKRKETIKMLDEFLRSVFLDMFGDPVRNEKGWPVLPMTQVFHIKTGKLDSNAAVKNGQYPFFTCSRENFKIDTPAFDCEALLLSGNNAAGDYSVKHYKGKFNAYQRTYILELKSLKNRYLFFKQLLEYKLSEMKQGSRGTNTKYLTISFFERLELFVPPTDIQMQFENINAVIRALVIKDQGTEIAMNNLFAALSQRAFREGV